MKKLSFLLVLVFLASCVGQDVLMKGEGGEAPLPLPVPSGTAAIIAAGTDTVARAWPADVLATEFSGATVEVEDDAYGAGWNGDTTHSPSQNAVYDVLVTMLPSIDEDNMASNSDAHVPTQQSVKAYADSVAGAPTNVTPVDTADEDATFYPLMVDGATGSQATETDGELAYNPSTGLYTIPNIALGTQAITDNAIVTVDQDGAADNDFAKFTAAGVEGRSYSEVISDLGLNTLGGLNTATSVVLIQYVQSAGAPDADDDITTYLEGTLWQDTSDNDNIYQLTDNTDGAAVWICITCVETLDDNDVVSLIGTAGTNTPTLYAIDTDIVTGVSASDDTWASAKAIDAALDTKLALAGGALTGQFGLYSANADPTATAGYILHDSTVTNHARGAVRWHDGTNIRQIVDMVAATAEGCTDDQVVSYDADNDLFYCKDDAGAAGGDSVSIDSSAVTDPDFVSTGDIDFVDTSNTITANINEDSVDPAHMANGDHGAFTYASNVASLDANSVDSDQYVDGSIDAVHLAADVIDETKLADDSIDSEHYNDDSIDAAHISDWYAYDTIPVGWMEDGTSAPDAIDTTTRTPLAYRTFASDADEDLNFVWFVPSDLSGSTIQFRAKYLITNATGPTAEEGVAWGLSGISAGDNDASNGAKGTVVVVTDDTLDAAQHDILITGWSGDVTVTNLAAGEVAEMAIIRDVSDAVDDYGQVVGLLAIEIRYVRNVTR